MAREKRWTNKQVFILVIVVLIAVAVALIVPNLVKNYYQNSGTLRGELATVAAGDPNDPNDPNGCPSGDKECRTQRCINKCVAESDACEAGCKKISDDKARRKCSGNCEIAYINCCIPC